MWRQTGRQGLNACSDVPSTPLLLSALPAKGVWQGYFYVEADKEAHVRDTVSTPGHTKTCTRTAPA